MGAFQLRIEQVEGYEFQVHFDGGKHPSLTLDEPPPLGRDVGPNPARILAAAIGDCLAASLVFCLARRKVVASGIRSDVRLELVRNAEKRLRIGRVDVTIDPGSGIPADVLEACLGTFEDFCVVTQSVRSGIDVRVEVKGAQASPNAREAGPER